MGLPPLVKGLTGAEYVTTATASTGQSQSPPKSVLGLSGTTTSGTTVRLDGFMEVPQLDTPRDNAAWDTLELSFRVAPGGPEADLALLEIGSGGDLSTWTVVAPRGVSSVRLPDLSQIPSLEAPSGPLSITVTVAKIDAFDYGSLRYASLTPRAWTAYATDVFQAHR